MDCSLAANTLVKVALMKEDKIRHGKILDWKDFDWKLLLHSCTGNSPATTDYDDFYWNELPVPIKTAAKALGYTRSSWNNDTGIPADSMGWDYFSKAQKDAASVLGYKPIAKLLTNSTPAPIPGPHPSAHQPRRSAPRPATMT